jgi:hypothetical protein
LIRIIGFHDIQRLLSLFSTVRSMCCRLNLQACTGLQTAVFYIILFFFQIHVHLLHQKSRFFFRHVLKIRILIHATQRRGPFRLVGSVILKLNRVLKLFSGSLAADLRRIGRVVVGPCFGELVVHVQIVGDCAFLFNFGVVFVDFKRLRVVLFVARYFLGFWNFQTHLLRIENQSLGAFELLLDLLVFS